MWRAGTFNKLVNKLQDSFSWAGSSTVFFLTLTPQERLLTLGLTKDYILSLEKAACKTSLSGLLLWLFNFIFLNLYMLKDISMPDLMKECNVYVNDDPIGNTCGLVCLPHLWQCVQIGVHGMWYFSCFYQWHSVTVPSFPLVAQLSDKGNFLMGSKRWLSTDSVMFERINVLIYMNW